MHAAQLLRIYFLESDHIAGKPALSAVLDLCREAGLEGITVLRGVEGIGMHGVHSSAFLSLSSKLPLVIEAIDDKTKIDAAIELLRPHLGHRLVATWPVAVMRSPEGASDA